MEEQDAPEGGEPTPKPDPMAELLEMHKQTNAHLLGEIAALKASVSAASKPKTPEMTPEQYKKLLEENPDAAVRLSVDKVVQEKMQPELQRLAANQQRERFDAKAYADFPLINTDPGFQKLVQSRMQEFIRDGEYTQESPKLLYRAAELAALSYKPKTAAKTEKSGMSGEAPSSVGERGSRSSQENPKNHEALNRVFNITSESAKKRVLEKIKAQDRGGRS